MATTSISDTHDDPRKPGESHTIEIMVELDREPDDPNYGADADGNRGIYVSGYWYATEEPPTTCEVCGHVYTAEEREDLQQSMNEAADDYQPDNL